MTGQPIKLWDWPVRVVHWSFVLLMPALWWTWKSNQMALHERLGYLTLALVLFRLFWGLFGSEPARFATFVKGPRAIAAYLSKLFSKHGEPSVGHNPLGGLSVIALLSLIVAEVGIGLFTQDTDGIESGPLTRYVSYDFADGARRWHGQVFDILLVFIALHLCAIAFYLVVKRENLIGPMLTGRRRLADTVRAPALAPWWRILPGAAIGLGAAWWVSLGAPLPK